jgi:hypothetical protein
VVPDSVNTLAIPVAHASTGCPIPAVAAFPPIIRTPPTLKHQTAGVRRRPGATLSTEGGSHAMS